MRFSGEFCHDLFDLARSHNGRNVDVEIDRSTWAPAPIFELIRRLGDVDQAELDRTFNMGVGMVALVAKADADRALAILTGRGVSAWVAGIAKAGSGHTELIGICR